MSLTYLSRDPFARMDYVRESERTFQGCAWCGSKRKTNKDGTTTLYRYGTQDDNGRTSWSRGLFCCCDCHDNYHGESRR